MDLRLTANRAFLLPAGPGGTPSPADLVWRLGLDVLAGSAALGVISRIGGHGIFTMLVFVAVGLWTWVAAIRLLMVRTRLRRFWIVLLAFCGFALLVSGPHPAGFAAAIALTVLFLLLRTYGPYRELSGSRRARFALIAFALVFFIPWSTGFVQPDGWLAGTLHRLAAYAGWSLRTFLLLSLLHIFLRMRLHFLRLRPKLAISGVFIALVPLVLFAFFAVLFLLVILGSDRAGRGASLLQEWAAGDYPVVLSGGPGFEARLDNGMLHVEGEHPGWLPNLVSAVQRPPAPPDSLALRREAERMVGAPTRRGLVVSLQSDEERIEELAEGWEAFFARQWAPADTSALVRLGSRLWALEIQGVGTPSLHLSGRLVDESAMDHLAELINADIHITGASYAWGPAGAPRDTTRNVPADTAMVRIALRGRAPGAAAQPDTSASIWHRPIYFGVAELKALRLRHGRMEYEQLVFSVQRSPASFFEEFTGRGDAALRGLLILLGIVGGLLLIVELVSLFLGIRITGGITSAVQALHAGTRRLAEGDLDARIELPNRDEFGDLARAFNTMAAAVKRGREEAIERERLEKELETAREIQQRLLPGRMPVLEGYEIAGTSRPSRQVGGDYFDFIELEGNRLGVAIGDVSGKGIGAALLMANLQAALQGQVIHPSTVAETVANVNDLLVRASEATMYATFFYGVLDGRDGSFIFCNAGHNPTLLMNTSGHWEWLSTGGIVIGMMSGQPYQEGRIVVHPGDILVLYTDGVTEAAGPPRGEDAEEEPDVVAAPRMFEEDRLVEVVRRNSGRSATEIRDAILAAVADYAAGTPQSDDITVVVIKRTG